MKISVNKSTFLNGIFMPQKISEGNASIQPILSNIQIQAQSDGKIICKTTDMSTSIVSEFNAEVFQPRTMTVNGKLLYQLASNLSGNEIEIQKNDTIVTIFSQKSHFEITSLRDDDYPTFSFYEDSLYTSFEAFILKEILDLTLFSAGTDESKPHLCGVYFITDKNIAKTVATDGHKLALAEYPYEGKFQVPSGIIIPRKGVTDIIKLLSDEHSNIGLYYDKDNKIIGIKCENTKMNIKLVDSKFPPYEQVIPQYKDNKVVIPKDDFLQALKRISLLFDTSDSGVIINVEKDRIIMSGIDTIKGKGREEIEVDYVGEPIQLAFNIKFFEVIINKIKGKEFSMFMHTPKSPVLFKPVDTTNFLAVLMPIRID